MSFNTAIDYNTFIDRIALTLEKSPLIFPKANGVDDLPNLVKQVIKYEFPLPEQPPDGLGPPHIWITVAPNPIRSKVPAGRGTRDIVAKELYELEFWAVCITQKDDPRKSQQELYSIVSAVKTAIGKNRRLTKPEDQTDPIAFGLEYHEQPYILRTETNDQAATNVVIRPKVFVDMTT